MGKVSNIFFGTLMFVGALTILRISACMDNLSDEEAREKARQVFKRGTDVTMGAAEGALEALTNEAKELGKRYDITGGRDSDDDLMRNLDATINDDLTQD